jgi:NADPH:quinone reductase-like Zn-dependent oxidoreductase
MQDRRSLADAEYVSIPQDGPLATIPVNVTYQEAAASTEGSHYPLAHVRGAKVRSGQDVLVNGATGAIGSAATVAMMNSVPVAIEILLLSSP